MAFYLRRLSLQKRVFHEAAKVVYNGFGIQYGLRHRIASVMFSCLMKKGGFQKRIDYGCRHPLPILQTFQKISKSNRLEIFTLLVTRIYLTRRACKSAGDLARRPSPRSNDKRAQNNWDGDIKLTCPPLVFFPFRDTLLPTESLKTRTTKGRHMKNKGSKMHTQHKLL